MLFTVWCVGAITMGLIFCFARLKVGGHAGQFLEWLVGAFVLSIIWPVTLLVMFKMLMKEE